MCSISGFYNVHGRYLETPGHFRDILSAMNAKQMHRGPDDDGILLMDTCGLSHTRLSIRDIKAGLRPMSRTVQGRMFTIVFNGEIYNTDELKRELIYAVIPFPQHPIPRYCCFHTYTMGLTL